MECFGKPDWNSCTEETLLNLSPEAPDEKIRRRVRDNWDHVAKPIDGLGSFESLTAQIGAIQGTEHIDISKKAVLILCADHGIVAEGVSQSGQEVTRAVAEKMAEQRSSVGKMAACIGADTIPVDIGINCPDPVSGLLDRRIRRGTGNFKRESAMTRQEAVRAVCTGIALAGECRDAGYRILATGEMGIGNTSAASAVAAALLGCPAEEVTGRGAGLDDERLLRKGRILSQALSLHGLFQNPQELPEKETPAGRAYALRVLETVGGLDIAGMAGVCIGGALYRLPVVLDGMVSMSAALLAQRLVPGTSAFLLPSHMGREPASERLAKELGLFPVIHAGMALGEGTGAVMMFSLLDIALRVYQDQTTFADIRIGQYERFSKT